MFSMKVFSKGFSQRSRVEFVSPGQLTDSLSAEDVRQGKTIRRNPTLTEHASHILPYRGMDSGIPRALGAWAKIDLVDDPAGGGVVC